MNKELGIRGEKVAIRYLVRRGFRLLDKNVKIKYGELDLVLFKDNKVHFVEVKYRNSEKDVEIEQVLSKRKIDKVTYTSKMWLKIHSMNDCDFQIGFIGIVPKLFRYKIVYVPCIINP